MQKFNNGDIVELKTKAQVMYINEDMWEGEIHLRFGQCVWGWFPLSEVSLIEKAKISPDENEKYENELYELKRKQENEKDRLFKKYYDK